VTSVVARGVTIVGGCGRYRGWSGVVRRGRCGYPVEPGQRTFELRPRCLHPGAVQAERVQCGQCATVQARAVQARGARRVRCRRGRAGTVQESGCSEGHAESSGAMRAVRAVRAQGSPGASAVRCRRERSGRSAVQARAQCSAGAGVVRCRRERSAVQARAQCRAGAVRSERSAERAQCGRGIPSTRKGRLPRTASAEGDLPPALPQPARGTTASAHSGTSRISTTAPATLTPGAIPTISTWSPGAS